MLLSNKCLILLICNRVINNLTSCSSHLILFKIINKTLVKWLCNLLSNNQEPNHLTNICNHLMHFSLVIRNNIIQYKTSQCILSINNQDSNSQINSHLLTLSLTNSIQTSNIHNQINMETTQEILIIQTNQNPLTNKELKFTLKNNDYNIFIISLSVAF